MISRQFIIYIVVGLLTAVLDIGTMQLALAFDAGVRFAVTLGFVVALIFNYLSHERITFNATTSTRTIVRFGIIVIINYLITLTCVFASLQWFGSVMPGKLVSLPIMSAVGFLSGKFWIFKTP
jgi:putative flippase GtrA